MTDFIIIMSVFQHNIPNKGVKSMNVAIMGHGVVGSGVAEILINHNSRISQRIKSEINVKYILDLRDFDNLPYSDRFIKDFNIILNDESVKIVAEVMGGINPAFDFVKKCLMAGKCVVTSNKELVAAKGAELIKIANEQNVNFLFEASVGGGIPVIRPMIQCLAANKINSITGILNGTTNFILDKMIVDNMEFDDALKLAQSMGYAEKDPSADIDGHDACRKICILATLAFGRHIYPEKIQTQGISDITLDDVEAADNFGCVIKLIGHAEQLADGKIYAYVRPEVISRRKMLSHVDGVFNAIVINGDQTGDVMFYGRGAGREATASAVVADIMDCAKHLRSSKYLYWEDGDDTCLAKEYSDPVSLFVRITGDNFAGITDQYEKIFGGNAKCIKNEYAKEISFITEPDAENILLKRLGGFKDCTVKVLHTML